MKSEIAAGFRYLVELFNPAGELVSSEICRNLIPDEGLNHICGVVLKGVTQVPTWYIAPYKGNYTPVAGVTAATVAAASTEATAYTPTARVEFVEGSVASGAVDNSATKAEFTFTAAETIYGGFIVSTSPKSGTTGTLLSIVRFPSPKVCDIGSVLRITAGIAFASI